MGIEDILRRHTIAFDRSKVRILTQTYKFNGEQLPFALALCRNDINFVSDVSKNIRLKLKNAMDRTPVSYYGFISILLDLIIIQYCNCYVSLPLIFPTTFPLPSLMFSPLRPS